MNIGQAAKQSGLSAKMIRYYEDLGLLPHVQRTTSGYRIYTEHDLKTLQFIHQSRQLGFSSEQMKALIELWKNPSRQSVDVKHLALQHIEQLQQKIVDLQAMVTVLQQAANACAGNQNAECQILNQLELGQLCCQHLD